MNFLFIIILVFLAIAFYMLYIKYKIHYNIIEGLDDKSLKDIIYKLATDTSATVTDISKLTAIQNALLTSNEASNNSLDSIANSIKSKCEYNNFIKLSGEERTSKIASLQSDTSPANSQLLAMLLGLTDTNNSTPKEYTYTEKIFIILNDADCTSVEKRKDNEKIESIKKESSPPPPPVKKDNSIIPGQVRKFIPGPLRKIGNEYAKKLGISKLFTRKKKKTTTTTTPTS
jgi:hypothetical protein